MIHLVCGPMFAGKTSELLRQAQRYRLANVGFSVIKPGVDDRFGATGEVVSHDGNRYPSESKPLMDYTRAENLLIDEAQFFDPDTMAWFLATRASNSRTVLFALDLDANGRPWPTTSLVACLADKVTKLTAVCERCGQDANRTQRLTPWPSGVGPSPVVIGAGADYAPRCVDHWSVR